MPKNIESFDYSIDINKITGSDKFVKIEKIVRYDQKNNVISTKFEVEGLFFKTSKLDKDKLTDKEKFEPLKNMVFNLKIAIKNEVKSKLKEIKQKLIKETEEKYNMKDLNLAIK